MRTIFTRKFRLFPACAPRTVRPAQTRDAPLQCSNPMPYSPLHFLRSGFSRRTALAWGVCLGLLGAGCADSPSSSVSLSPEEVAAADSVLALLERIDETALRSAFGDLAHRAHVQRIRTVQFDARGTALASSEREVRHDEEGAREIRSESSGAFDFGYLRRFASTDGDAEEIVLAASDYPDRIIPEDPSYAAARNREAWRYEFAPDSALSARPVRVIRITARPGFAASRSIRRVDMYLDPARDILAGLYVERTHSALWFREESAFFLSAAPLASGAWAPDRARFETRLKLLLRPAQRFRSEAEYYDFREMNQGRGQYMSQ